MKALIAVILLDVALAGGWYVALRYSWHLGREVGLEELRVQAIEELIEERRHEH